MCALINIDFECANLYTQKYNQNVIKYEVYLRKI